LLGSLGTLWLVLRAHDSGESKWGWLAAVVFFLACLAKENAVTFLAVVPLALWVFRGASAGAVVRNTWPLLVGFAVFLAIRFSILGVNTGKPLPELMNDPFLKQVGSGWAPFSPAEKFATVFFTLGKYVLLLLVPHPLTHDYYPRQIGILNFGNPGALLSLLLYIGLAVYGFSGLKKRDPLRFGIVFFLLTLSLVSNLVISIGTNMAERFLFMPSVGFCLAVAVLLTNLLRRNGSFDVSKLTTPLLVAGVVAALFSLKTILRNPAWESNEKLFFTDVATSRNSAKIHNACGGVLADKANVERDPALRERMATQAVGHLDKDYSDAFASRGKANAILSNFDKSIADYREAVRLKPNDPNMIRSLAIVLRDGGRYYGQQKKDLNTARKMFEESWKINPKDPQTAMNLGTANGLAGDAAAAINWFQRAVDLEPTNASSIFDLATAYAQAGDINKANELYAKAQQLDPQIAQKKRGGQ
jgi:Flp pilus assembly protein TadD